MDKKLKYEKAILSFLNDYARIKPVNWRTAENQVVSDRENHHYQLVRLGWKEGQFVHFVVFHFDLIGDKVWVQQNHTDLPVADELEDLGVDPNDIVFAFMESEWKPNTAALA
ncbi:MAG: XisI protein [Saprospiraceae bacterium]